MEYIKNNELIKDEIYYVSTDNYDGAYQATLFLIKNDGRFKKD